MMVARGPLLPSAIIDQHARIDTEFGRSSVLCGSSSSGGDGVELETTEMEPDRGDGEAAHRLGPRKSHLSDAVSGTLDAWPTRVELGIAHGSIAARVLR